VITIDLTAKAHTADVSEERHQGQPITRSKVERATLRSLERLYAQTQSRTQHALFEESHRRILVQQEQIAAAIQPYFVRRLLQESFDAQIRTHIPQLYDPLEQIRRQQDELYSMLRPAAYEISHWSHQYPFYDYAAVDRDLCAKALAAVTHGESEEFSQFVVQTLGLPITHVTAVWMVLREGRWVHARRPLRYIWKAAKCQFAREECHHPDQPPSTNDDQLIRPILTNGPSRKVVGTIIEPQDPRDHITELNAIQTLDAACHILGMSDEGRLMAQATLLYELPRRQLQRQLRWSVQQTERAWKEFSRRREQLILVLKKIS